MAGWKITIRGGAARCCADDAGDAAASNRPAKNSRRLIAHTPPYAGAIPDRIRLRRRRASKTAADRSQPKPAGVRLVGVSVLMPSEPVLSFQPRQQARRIPA